MNDANALQRSNLSDDELIEMMYPIIKKNEDAKPYPYYDTRWNITVGVGNNINNKKDFYNKKEKLKIQQERIQTKQDPDEHNYVSDYFTKFCKIRIDEDTMHQMSVDHMRGDLQSLRILIPNFDKLSLNKKLVLMDYIYNLGEKNLLRRIFQTLLKEQELIILI